MDARKRLYTLPHLRLDGCELTAFGVTTLATARSKNATCTSLNLRGEQASKSEVAMIAKALKENDTLQELSWTDYVRDDGMIALAHSLKQNSTFVGSPGI